MSSAIEAIAPSPHPFAGTQAPAWRQVLAIAGVEIRLSLRSPAFWILLVGETFFIVAFGAYSVTQIHTVQSTLSLDVAVQVFLFPLLIAQTVARNRARRVLPLLQTRPVATTIYAMGQWLGDLLLCLGLMCWLLWLVFALFWLRSVTAPTRYAPPVLFNIWILALPTLILAGLVIVSWATLCIRLSPVPFLGALLASGTLFLAAYGTPSTLLRPMDLPLDPAFFSPSIGFGPDTILVQSEWGIEAGVGLAALALSLAIGHWRERAAVAQLRHWLLLGVVASMAALLLSISCAAFIPATSLLKAALGPVEDPLLSATSSQYDLKVAIDLASGALSGNATFHLSPTASCTTGFIWILNPGLTVTRATIAGQSQIVTSRQGWHRIACDGTALADGKTAQISITYRGSLTLPRDDYATYIDGKVWNSYSVGHVPIAVQDYAGQGMAYLQSGGDWYPRPWITGEPERYFSGTPLAAVTVALPAQTHVVTALGTISKEGDRQVVQAQPDGPLPRAFLVALTGVHSMMTRVGPIMFQGDHPAAATMTLATDLLDAAHRLESWLGDANLPWTAVIVPLIDSPQVGPGVLFVPEISSLGYTDDSQQPDTEGMVSLFPEYSSWIAPYAGKLGDFGRWRVMAQLLTDGWFTSRFAAPDILPANEKNYFNAPAEFTAQAAIPRVIFESSPDPLFEMLAQYTAGVLMSDAAGPASLSEEIYVRQLFLATVTVQVAQGLSSKAPADPAAASFSQAEIAVLEYDLHSYGLSDSSENVLAMYALEQRIGRPAMTEVLRNYLTTRKKMSVSLPDFTTFVTQQTGQDFSAYLARYSLPPLAPSGGG